MLLLTSLGMDLMHFLVLWFLVSALDTVARHCPRGPIVITSPDNTDRAIVGLTFFLQR
jgi:hypothetical protein